MPPGLSPYQRTIQRRPASDVLLFETQIDPPSK